MNLALLIALAAQAVITLVVLQIIEAFYNVPDDPAIQLIAIVACFFTASPFAIAIASPFKVDHGY